MKMKILIFKKRFIKEQVYYQKTGFFDLTIRDYGERTKSLANESEIVTSRNRK